MSLVLLALAAVVLAGYVYLVRAEGDRTVRLWAGSWSIFAVWMLISAAVDQMGFEFFIGLSHGITTILVLVGVMGAFSYADRPFPDWLRNLAIGVAVVRGLLASLGYVEVSLSIMIATEPSLLVAAGLSVLRSVGISGSRVISSGLGIGYFSGAIGMGSLGVALMTSQYILPVALMGACASLFQAVFQILSILSRVRTREHREKQTLRAVLDTAPVGVLLESEDGTIGLMNRIAKLHLGDTLSAEWQGRPIVGLMESLATRVQGGAERLSELYELRAEGQLSDVEIEIGGPEPRQLVLFSSPVATQDGASLGWIWVSRDVTEERRLQADLARSQRLDTIGRLAGGIAHDFNNQLTTILGNAKLLEDKATDPASRGSLDDLVLAAEHCGRLTRSLLSFARDSQFPPAALSVQNVLGQVQQLLRPLLPATIELRIHVDDDTHPIAADPTQLHQVLVNLAINARDAISGAGKIEIRARNQVEAGATPMVEISVVDSGSGMEPHVAERIFEPFFTTKSSGEGTGLGLSIVESVVMAHSGTIAVESNQGEGTTILIRWPAGEQISDDASIDRPRRDSAEGNETILIADDESGLRRLICNILQSKGYSVAEAANGQQAIDRFVEQREKIGLVIFDITMPDVTGLEALDRIRELDETIPAILMSGLESPSPMVSSTAETIFLMKPFDNHELVEKVRRLLDSAARGR